ncbi:MAG: DUF1587 domain-containing protein, partial [Sandaracinaceae bacterium]
MAWVAALAIGCTGSVTAPSGGSAPTTTEMCRDAEPSLGHVTLRRLSRVEYQNTIRDLLYGVAVAELPNVPGDVAEEGFENVAARLSAPALLVETYEETATRYARAAVEDEATLRQVLGCDGWETSAEKEACRASFLQGFLRRAYRRPPTAAETDALGAFFDEARA